MPKSSVTLCPPAYDRSLEYDRWQFHSAPSHEDLTGKMDWADAQRMQIFEVSAARKPVPAWVTDYARLREVILSHPQAPKLAAKWARILYLYYFKQYTARDVAEIMNLSVKSVERTIEQLNHRAIKWGESAVI